MNTNLPMEFLELEERWLRHRLNEVREELHRRRRRLASLWIRFIPPSHQGEECMSPQAGALTLTTAGETARASVIGFDQNGQPMPADFAMPAVSFSIDDTAVASVDDAGTVTAVAAGTTVLNASVTSAEGTELKASADVDVEIAAPPEAPVLSSIQVTFDEPVAAAAVDNRSPNEKLNAALVQA